LHQSLRNYRLKRFTRVTIWRIAEFERELAKVRRNGYAIDDQEFEEGLMCIGAPVRDRTGSAVAALSIAGPVMRLRADRMPELVRAVREAAAGFCSALGYRPAAMDRAGVS
jgi:DNA-binding IclR family transcriptional regulator